MGHRPAGDNGEALPLVTRPPNFPPPIDRPHQRRPPVRPRALFRRRAYNSSDESSGGEEETDEDGDFDADVSPAIFGGSDFTSAYPAFPMPANTPPCSCACWPGMHEEPGMCR